MIDVDNKFSKNYTINIYDVDTNLKCKFSSLTNYIWDVVISQSDALGETYEGLVNNCIWVLLKYDIKIYEYPRFKEVINVDTDVLGVKKIYGYRSNTIRNSSGKIVAEVVSTAILIDIEKRRPMKISPDQFHIYGIKGDLEGNIPLDDLLKVENEDCSMDFLIRRSDIDSNGHVNNAKYMEMAIETLPSYIINNKLSNIKVLFKKETAYGDIVHVSSQIIVNNDTSYTTVHIITNNDGKTLTKLQFQWEKE